MYKSTPMIDDTKQNKIEGIKDKKHNKRRSDWYFPFQYLMAPKGAILLVVLKNQCGPSRHLPGFSTISWGEDLVQALWFCWSIFFARVLVEVQFLGYRFGLKGLTYTRENTVFGAFSERINEKMNQNLWLKLHVL